MTDDFPLTPIIELKEYKKLLKQELAEYEESMNTARKHRDSLIKELAKRDNPRASDLVHAENNLIKSVQRYNGLYHANQLFKKVKENHNKSIQKTKDDGILLREIQETEKLLTTKKERAKDRGLALRKKKKEKEL